MGGDSCQSGEQGLEGIRAELGESETEEATVVVEEEKE